MLKKSFAKIGAATLGTILFTSTAYAQPYNQGAYNTTTYSTGLVRIGPIVLPVTGPQLLGVLSAAAIAVAIGLIVWMREQKNQA